MLAFGAAQSLCHCVVAVVLQLDSLAASLLVAPVSQSCLKRGPLSSNDDIFDFIVDGFLGLEVVEALSLFAFSILELMQNVPIVYVTRIHNCLG